MKNNYKKYEQLNNIDNSKLKNKVIAKIQIGAQLYGMATSDSDIDYKGVYLPSKKQILLGKFPNSIDLSTSDKMTKNTSKDVDYEIYSFHYFIKLALNCQTLAMDMLHAPSNMVIISSEIWDELVALRCKFYSKFLMSFVDYARSQAAKYSIKGSRINAVLEILNILKAENNENKMKVIWDKLPDNKYCFHIGTDPNGISQYKVCGKIIQKSAKIGYVEPILKKLYNEYGKRAKLAAENKNIDWKAVSHALRIAYQAKEILEFNTISFPLKNADFLLKVKQGNLNYIKDVAPIFDELIDNVENLVNENSLPEKADQEFWDQYICKTIEKAIFT